MPNEDQEKEAAMFFALQDFAVAIKNNGAHNVLSSMDEETFWALYKWFSDMYQFDFRSRG